MNKDNYENINEGKTMITKTKRVNGAGRATYSFSLKPEIMDRFYKHCEERCLWKSQILEKIILKFMKEGDQP